MADNATDNAAKDEDGGKGAERYRCVRCRRVLGVCWADRFDVGNARFRKPVTIECLSCGALNKWYPSRL